MNNFDVMRMLTQFSNRQLMFNKNISQTKQTIEEEYYRLFFNIFHRSMKLLHFIERVFVFLKKISHRKLLKSKLLKQKHYK